MAVIDLDEATTTETVEAVRAAGARAIGIGADVSKTDDVEAAVARVVDELGAPTILINNAGILRDNLLFRMTDSDWDAVIAVDLRGAFLMSRAVQRRRRGRGLLHLRRHLLRLRPGALCGRRAESVTARPS